ncbi:hypothetical protein D4R86_03245 [bacterium]|nr:MAG: hypothetical protein D4R86_03245 [bacterium]
MQFHELKPIHLLKKRKRVGRGGKKGTYSGRGVKGQKSRAGGTPRPVLRDIIKKFPKRRGYKFAGVKKQKPVVLNVSILEEKFKAGEIIDIIKLRANKFIRKKDRLVKILGDGELKKSLIFKGYNISFSKSALEKIKKAGGKIETKQKIRSTLPRAERPKKVKKTAEPEKKKISKNIANKEVEKQTSPKKEKIDKKPKDVKLKKDIKRKIKKTVKKKKDAKIGKGSTKSKSRIIKKKDIKKVAKKR